MSRYTPDQDLRYRVEPSIHLPFAFGIDGSWNYHAVTRGYRHFLAEEQGQNVRLRPESFANHSSIANEKGIIITVPAQ